MIGHAIDVVKKAALVAAFFFLGLVSLRYGLLYMVALVIGG